MLKNQNGPRLQMCGFLVNFKQVLQSAQHLVLLWGHPVPNDLCKGPEHTLRVWSMSCRDSLCPRSSKAFGLL